MTKRLPDNGGDALPEAVATLYRRALLLDRNSMRLVQRHNFAWSYTWTKTFLHSKGLLERAKRRGAHRRKRPRRPLPGMMLHQDGSRHAWLGGQPALDLIVTLDDATSAILSAFLVEEEGTASTFRALREVFERHGLPLSLYTDRGAHYFYTADANEKAGRAGLTQVGRALEHLGVEHIAAYSPQARGRSERAFHTLQDRLTKELALAGIDDIEGANAFIRDVYIPAHNARFAIAAEQQGSAFVAIPGVDLAEVLCVQEDRDVGNDNCVRFKTLRLQIPESPLRAHFVNRDPPFRAPHALAMIERGSFSQTAQTPWRRRVWQATSVERARRGAADPRGGAARPCAKPNSVAAGRRRAGRARVNGRGGLDPARYGDWEVKGIAADF